MQDQEKIEGRSRTSTLLFWAKGVGLGIVVVAAMEWSPYPEWVLLGAAIVLLPGLFRRMRTFISKSDRKKSHG